MKAPTKQPRVIVCAGGGGVGKTTSSAALAWALAKSGKTALVVTVDPARRLADALGVKVDTRAHTVDIDEDLEGRLWALMPEPQRSTRDFIEDLFIDEPEALKRLLNNRLYQVIEDKLAGMHELAAVTLIARTVREIPLDFVIIDTAPSRNALEFMGYPLRLSKLLEGKAIAWISRLAERASDGKQTKRRGIFSWGRRRVEGLFGKVLGVSLLNNLADLFSELALVRERFANITNQSHELLLGHSTRYLFVAAPTGAARADVSFLVRSLREYQRRPEAVLINRADIDDPKWSQLLQESPETTKPMHIALKRLERERLYRSKAAEETVSYFKRNEVGLLRIRLPLIESADPTEIVRTLAEALTPHLKVICGDL